eukprot:14800569-Alexandrium_andersonii.AAC.1
MDTCLSGAGAMKLVMSQPLRWAPPEPLAVIMPSTALNAAPEGPEGVAGPASAPKASQQQVSAWAATYSLALHHACQRPSVR